MSELAGICRDVAEAIDDGHYDVGLDGSPGPSLAEAIVDRALVAEVKLDAPTWEEPIDRDPLDLARAYVEAGVDGISVLTERDRFDGSPTRLAQVAGLGPPTLMKDFVLDEPQIGCARRCGASAVLLIQAVFDADLARVGRDALIEAAHDHGLEVLLEASTVEGFARAKASDADILAANARRLDTLDVSLGRALEVLAARDDRPTLLLSGISDRKDAERAWAIADGILVGSALARADDPAEVIASWRA